ncbi:MAG: guanylate kinase [Candidatus Krumholzibacteria bacterium]|nr:guanylate kinase [Candidatus Krumholzibacteria bacterium]
MLSGPSGVGKSTVGDRVLAREAGLVRSVSLTTRPPRRGDVDGRDYRFVPVARFEELRESGRLLEWAEVHGHLYGTEAAWVDGRLAEGKDVLLEIDVQGGMSVKERRPDSALVFLLPPSRDDLERRLRGRATDREEDVVRRLANASAELAAASRYDYIVVNDDLDRCVADVRGILAAERLRTSRTSLGG